MKVNRTISIEYEINKMANDRTDINVSALCEEALTKKLLAKSVSEQEKEILLHVLDDYAAGHEKRQEDNRTLAQKVVDLREAVKKECVGKDFRTIMQEVKRKHPLRIGNEREYFYLTDLLAALKEAPLSNPQEKEVD